MIRSTAHITTFSTFLQNLSTFLTNGVRFFYIPNANRSILTHPHTHTHIYSLLPIFHPLPMCTGRKCPRCNCIDTRVAQAAFIQKQQLQEMCIDKYNCNFLQKVPVILKQLQVTGLAQTRIHYRTSVVAWIINSGLLTMHWSRSFYLPIKPGSYLYG